MKHRSLIFTQIFMAIGITIIKGKLLVAKVIFAFSKYHSLFKTNIIVITCSFGVFTPGL